MPSQPCIIQKTETKNNFVFKQRVGDIFIVANTAGVGYVSNIQTQIAALDNVFLEKRYQKRKKRN